MLTTLQYWLMLAPALALMIVRIAQGQWADFIFPLGALSAFIVAHEYGHILGHKQATGRSASLQGNIFYGWRVEPSGPMDADQEERMIKTGQWLGTLVGSLCLILLGLWFYQISGGYLLEEGWLDWNHFVLYFALWIIFVPLMFWDRHSDRARLRELKEVREYLEGHRDKLVEVARETAGEVDFSNDTFQAARGIKIEQSDISDMETRDEKTKQLLSQLKSDGITPQEVDVAPQRSCLSNNSFCHFRSSQRFFTLGIRIAAGAKTLCGLSIDCDRKRDDENGGERGPLEHGFSSRRAVARPASGHISARRHSSPALRWRFQL